MTRVAASSVRKEFSDTLNRVAYKSERIVLERRGRAVAALVPIEDLELLEALEDRLNLGEARKALRKHGKIPRKALRAGLGL